MTQPWETEESNEDTFNRSSALDSAIRWLTAEIESEGFDRRQLYMLALEFDQFNRTGVIPGGDRKLLDSGLQYVLYSHGHRMWWGPDRSGYVSSVDEAGRYTQDQAVQIVVQSALHGLLDKVTSMVAAPPRTNAEELANGEPR